MINKIGRHEVLLQINHNRYNFRTKKEHLHLGQISPVETMSQAKNFLYFGNSPFFRDQWLLLWFLWLILLLVDFADLWLVTSTVRLHVSNYSQLSDYTVRLQLYTVISEKLCSKCTNHIEEIVTVTMNPMLIYMLIVHAHCRNTKIRLLVKLYKYWSADRDLTHFLRHNH